MNPKKLINTTTIIVTKTIRMTRSVKLMSALMFICVLGVTVLRVGSRSLSRLLVMFGTTTPGRGEGMQQS